MRISIPAFVVLGVAPAAADIYECTGKKSMPTYQNFPCEFDSLGDLPSPPAAAATTSTARTAAAGHAPVRAGNPDSRVHRAGAAPAPRVGMSADEVKAIWGQPIDTSKEELRKGTIETWTYADSRSIEFDRKGRVTGIKW